MIRIIHCPTSTGGNAVNLAKAERTLGAKSVCVAIKSSNYNETADKEINSKKPGSIFLNKIILFFRIILFFDVVHYNSGKTLFQYSLNHIHSLPKKSLQYYFFKILIEPFEMIDLKICRIFNKKILMTYNGSDARQYGYIVKRHNYYHDNALDSKSYNLESDRFKQRRIKLIEKYADAIFSVNPDLLHVLPKRSIFIPYTTIDFDEWKYGNTNNSNGSPLKIMHAPTNREIKGTAYLIEASKKLLDDGYEHELLLVEGVDHDQMKNRINGADVFVDQLIIGWYGGAAVEAMALGKPVIAYINHDDLGFINNEMVNEIPIINANPDSIYYVLKEVIKNGRAECRKVGHASEKFVRKWHDPSLIAKQIADHSGYGF